MTEKQQHEPVNDISGNISCTCGVELGHFAYDADKWEAYDEHVARSNDLGNRHEHES